MCTMNGMTFRAPPCMLHTFRQHVSVVKWPSSGLQRAENAMCKGFL